MAHRCFPDLGAWNEENGQDEETVECEDTLEARSSGNCTVDQPTFEPAGTFGQMMADVKGLF